LVSDRINHTGKNPATQSGTMIAVFSAVKFYRTFQRQGAARLANSSTRPSTYPLPRKAVRCRQYNQTTDRGKIAHIARIGFESGYWSR
jgi:hypothetical protein